MSDQNTQTTAPVDSYPDEEDASMEKDEFDISVLDNL